MPPVQAGHPVHDYNSGHRGGRLRPWCMGLTYGYLFQRAGVPGPWERSERRGTTIIERRACGVFFATCFSAIALVFALFSFRRGPTLVDLPSATRGSTPRTRLLISSSG